MRDLEERTRQENKELVAQNRKMKALLDAEKKDQECQVEIITMENFTRGVLDTAHDPDARFKVEKISAAQFLFH